MSSLAPLRIVMHDYGGHPFPLQLSRTLVQRGHEVLHLYFPQCLNPLAIDRTEDSARLTIRGIPVSGTFHKFSFIRRRFQEVDYGKRAAAAIGAFAPDLVISSTTPLEAQKAISALCDARKIPVLFWLQDVHSIAMARILPKKIPLIGGMIAQYYRRLERRILRRSAGIVAISQPFVEICAAMGVAKEKCHLIENWAPLEEIRPLHRRNAWSYTHDLSDKRVILCSGTLGFKHNPALFERLALHFRTQPDVRVVVISEGLGADWLRARKVETGLDNLIVLPYQPYARFGQALASGEVLLAILEEDAGAFSVPSKVLSYLSAGKPILLSIPPTNLAAETVRRADAGRVVAPHDVEGLIAAADEMLADSALCAALGRNARRYAERTFNIVSIADRFEAIFAALTVRTSFRIAPLRDDGIRWPALRFRRP